MYFTSKFIVGIYSNCNKITQHNNLTIIWAVFDWHFCSSIAVIPTQRFGLYKDLFTFLMTINQRVMKTRRSTGNQKLSDVWRNWIVYDSGFVGRVAQSVYRLTTGWKVRGSRFIAHVQTGPGAHPASCKMRTWSFPGVKWPGRGADHPPLPSAEVENE
jgi:hypothetical protein